MSRANRFKNALLVSVIFFISVLGSRAYAQVNADFISTPSEAGVQTFHPHLVMPGTVTSYLIRVQNIWDKPAEIELSAQAEKNGSWLVKLSEEKITGLKPGEAREVVLSVQPSALLKPGEVIQLKVHALAEGAFKDCCTVVAETASQRKVYFVSIDSLNPLYLNLNASGDGPGKDGDWLMPNLHRLMQRSTWYPKAKVHIIAATDMNHFNYLAGTMTGSSGIPLVGAAFFGFDSKGNPITVPNGKLKSPITIYDGGKKVQTIFNSAKTSNSRLWTAFVSGKGWVPDMMRFPDYQLDRIITGTEAPEWANPIAGKDEPQKKQFLHLVSALLSGPGKSGHQFGNPENLKEPQDRREGYFLAKLMEAAPTQFPPDNWVMDAGIAELKNEDPDVLYLLLAAVDDAGRAFGSAFDPSEWDTRGTETLKDDVSRFDQRASRQGIINVVRDADFQVGRFLDLLAERGTLDNSIIIAESDHAMVTHFRKALDMGAQLKKAGKFKPGEDFFFGGATSVGMVAAKKGDPRIIPDVEAALESWRVKNPLTGKLECPVIVYNREEMKTGFDKATGKQWMLPREYYSEYYIEHRQPGEIYWADLLVLTADNYRFKLEGFGLGNLGMAGIPLKLPKWGYFIGGHGSFDTQTCLLMVSVPGAPSSVRDDQVYAMDVAPTIERLQGWALPDSTDGKGLPGLDPTLK